MSKDGKSPVKNGIAVIILQEDAKLLRDVLVIPLPKTDIAESGSSCTAIGWGRTSDNDPTFKVFQKTNLLVKSPSECTQHYKPLNLHQGFSCAYGFPSGICFGDSGGPFVCKDLGGSNASASPFYLFGVASAGQVPCGAAGRYEVFSRVGYSEHLSFITNTISQKVTVKSGRGEVVKISAWINSLESIGTLYWFGRN